MPVAWRRLLLAVVAVVGAGLAVGAWFGLPLVGLALALAGLLAHHLHQLLKLEQALRERRAIEVPDSDGIWGRVLSGIRYQQQRVRRHKKRYRQLMREVRQSTDALPDGVIVLSGDNEILRYNAAARQLLGLRKRLDRGRRIDHLVRHPDFIDYLGRGDYAEPVVLPSPRTDDGWLSLRIVPYSEDNRLLTVRDVTERTRLSRTRRDFVANASHELRTPLTVLSGYLEAMREDPQLLADWGKPLAEMSQQAGRMRQMLDELLALSRLEASAQAPADKAVDIAELIGQCTALFDVEPGRIEAEISSDCAVYGEQAELHSVLSNLISNALRYGDPGAPVFVRWYDDGADAVLSVEDRGEGIAADDIPRLTERFFRVNRGRGRDTGGVGLGLAIVKHALARHDATLSIDSTPGEGSRFDCHFPARRLQRPGSPRVAGAGH